MKMGHEMLLTYDIRLLVDNNNHLIYEDENKSENSISHADNNSNSVRSSTSTSSNKVASRTKSNEGHNIISSCTIGPLLKVVSDITLISYRHKV